MILPSDRANNQMLTLGMRLRELRKRKGWTLKRLSDASGMSVSNLSKIEVGRVSMNFATVNRIAEAMETPIAMLLGPVETSQVTGRRAITRSNETHPFANARYTLEILCDDLAHKKSVFWRATIKTRSLDAYGELSRHPGEEFLYVLSGQLALHTELYKPVILSVGDSISFDSLMGHAYISVSDDPCVLLMSNTLPGGGMPGYDDTSTGGSAVPPMIETLRQVAVDAGTTSGRRSGRLAKPKA